MPIPLLALWMAPADAAQLRVARSELCEVASHVVLAEVTSGETRWRAGTQGGIERVRWLHVVDGIRGGARTDLEVVLPGGTIGEVTHWVEDVPELLTNGTYLLFLIPTEAGLQPVGGDQGAVRVALRPGHPGEPLASALASVEVCRG